MSQLVIMQQGCSVKGVLLDQPKCYETAQSQIGNAKQMTKDPTQD